MPAGTSQEEIPSIAEGIFFEATVPLPRGRNSIDPERVKAAQRERMLAAVTELMAALGYRAFKVSDIARRAGVSLAAFYECFEGKDDCIFQGYDRFIDVLLKRMIGVNLEDKNEVEFTADLIDAYIDALSADLVVARAYQLEIDTLGVPARTRRRDSLTLFARHIQQRVEEFAAGSQGLEEIPWVAYLGFVYAARQLVSDALEEPDPDLSALSVELQAWSLDVFRDRQQPPHS